MAQTSKQVHRPLVPLPLQEGEIREETEAAAGDAESHCTLLRLQGQREAAPSQRGCGEIDPPLPQPGQERRRKLSARFWRCPAERGIDLRWDRYRREEEAPGTLQLGRRQLREQSRRAQTASRTGGRERGRPKAPRRAPNTSGKSLPAPDTEEGAATAAVTAVGTRLPEAAPAGRTRWGESTRPGGWHPPWGRAPTVLQPPPEPAPTAGPPRAPHPARCPSAPDGVPATAPVHPTAPPA